MLDRLLKIIGLPAAVVGSVVLTWDSVTGLDLGLRLIITLILAVIVQEGLARWLAPAPAIAPADLDEHKDHADSPASLRIFVSALMLAIAAATVSGFAWLQTELLVISAERSDAGARQSLTLTASWVVADHVLLQLPPPPVECDFKERGATLTEIDWEQPDRSLRIDNFVSPQFVTVACATDTQLDQRGIQVSGAADGPYFVSELEEWRVLIIIFGVVTWLYGLVRFGWLWLFS